MYCINSNTNSMLIVQYPMQFSGPPRNISKTHAEHRFVQMVVQLTQLGFMHYYPLNNSK